MGVKGKGESVWLGWFLIQVMHDYAELLNDKRCYKEEALRLAKVIEENAWDGAWYLRTYYDDGTPIGSHLNNEALLIPFRNHGHSYQGLQMWKGA